MSQQQHKNKLEDLKCSLQLHQEIFYKPIFKAKAATISSCKITETLLKKEKKPFEDGYYN
jgi:hypothetical protein